MTKDERIKQLEGHRDVWRRRAWHLEDLIRAGNFEAARAAVAASDEKARHAFDAPPRQEEGERGT